MSQIKQKCPKLIPSNCRLPGSTNFQLRHYPFCQVLFPPNPHIMHSSIIKIIHSQIIRPLTTLVSSDDDRSKVVALRLVKFQGGLNKKLNLVQLCSTGVKPIFLPSLVCGVQSMYPLCFRGDNLFSGDNVLLGREIWFTKFDKDVLNNQRTSHSLCFRGDYHFSGWGPVFLFCFVLCFCFAFSAFPRWWSLFWVHTVKYLYL